MEEGRISVLYIDDEIGNLNVFKASFRYDYDIQVCTSGLEAYELLKNFNFHIIIADQRMPGITGVQFFESIVEKHKHCIRILLTAYADIESAIDSINKGKVFRYIKKPWDEQEIRMTIQNAYEVYYARKSLFYKNQELVKINEELNRFVYSASHDLKAPLLSIKGLLNLARLEGNNKDPDLYFSMITNSVNQLEVFIGNILNYYKNVRADNHFTPIDFAKIVDETIFSYQFYYYSSEINYTIDIPTYSKFMCDEFRIRVIINNILSNAIKYQRADEPVKKIYISVRMKENHAVLIIEDNGIGIDNQYLNDIYNMFFRATRENSGSGIGLYIVKEAVSKVAGEMFVTSVEGVGTKFEIHIPAK